MNVRIRFDPSKAIRLIKGRDLVPNPKNWRSHPEGQIDALKGILAEVGVADVVKGFQLPDGRVMLIDGHARAEVMPDQEIPVLVLDVTEAEAKKLLATFDSVGDMAGVDSQQLAGLLAECEFENSAVMLMLAELAEKSGLGEPPEAAAEEEPAAEDLIREQFQIVIQCDSEREQAKLLERFTAEGLKCKSLIS